jgi:hypothetical protein
MIRLKDLQPDQALKDLLDGKITIDVSANESRIAKVYKQGERPNTNLGDEFVEILHNGVIRSMTKPFGFYRGNLAIMLYCKAQTDGTAKFNRINSMLSQMETLTKGKSSGKFFFDINEDNIITPISVNATTGYATMTLNIAWHTTE